MLDKLLNGIRKLASFVNVGDKTKGSLQAIKDDFTSSFALRKPDLDLDYDPATGKVILELNHGGAEARLPFGRYIVDGAHNLGIGQLEGGNGPEREVLAPLVQIPATED